MAHVLIIDSQSVVREPLVRVISAGGTRASGAATARQAAAVIAATPVDLIVLDLALPDSPGLDLLRALRAGAATQATPVLVLTARSSKADVLAAMELGVQGYALKEQFELARFLADVERLIAPASAGVAEAKPATKPPAAAAPSPSAPLAFAPNPAAPPPITSVKPLAARSDILRRLDGFTELRALSPTLAQVLKLTRSASASVESVAAAIRCDHAIALKIIKLANSPAYTRGEPVNSVKKAVVRIGMDQIRQAVLNIGVVEQFSAGKLGEELSYPQFWEHAVATGIIAAQIAAAKGSLSAEAAFTTGLLHDVGRVVMAEQLPEEYREVLRTARRLRLPLEQVEKRMLLMTHADIMDRVLHRWQVPRDLIEPVAYHQLSAGSIRQVAPLKAAEIMVIALADRLAHAMMLGCSGNRTIYGTEELCEALSVDGGVIRHVEETAGHETDEVKLAMLSNADAGAWSPSVEAVRKSLERPVRIVFASAAPAIDAFRVFCERVSDGALEQPNLAVAHLRHARDRAPVAARLQERLAEAGCGPLPTIVISNGQLTLPEVGPYSEVLCDPMPIDAFAAAASRLLAAPARAAA